MRNIEELANKVLQARGYLVIGHDSKMPIPCIIAGAFSTSGAVLDHQLALVAQTDESDYIRQAEFVGMKAKERHEYYYRALAE
jgi:hypothetical protein